MDLCLYAKYHLIPLEEAAAACGLTTDQVQRVFNNTGTKRSTTCYLHLNELTKEPVSELLA